MKIWERVKSWFKKPQPITGEVKKDTRTDEERLIDCFRMVLEKKIKQVNMDMGDKLKVITGMKESIKDKEYSLRAFPKDEMLVDSLNEEIESLNSVEGRPITKSEKAIEMVVEDFVNKFKSKLGTFMPIFTIQKRLRAYDRHLNNAILRKEPFDKKKNEKEVKMYKDSTPLQQVDIKQLWEKRNEGYGGGKSHGYRNNNGEFSNIRPEFLKEQKEREENRKSYEKQMKEEMLERIRKMAEEELTGKKKGKK